MEQVRPLWMTLGAACLLVASLTGCGKSDTPPQSALAVAGDAPAQAGPSDEDVAFARELNGYLKAKQSADSDLAMLHLNAALEIKPNNIEMLLLRGINSVATNPEQSVADATKVLGITPDSAAARMVRAQAYLKLDRMADAHMEIKRILDMPENEHTASARELDATFESMSATIDRLRTN